MHIRALVVLLLAVSVAFGGYAVFSPSRAASSDQVQARARRPEKTPISVKCRIEGNFNRGYEWNLAVKPDGAALLSIESYPQSKQRRFKVTAAQLAALRKVIEAEHFFELGDPYGDEVPDSSIRTLTIVSGSRSKTLTLRYLRVEGPKLPEVKRAVRVWNTVRGWFHDKDAVDLRPYDQRLLDAP